MKISFNWLNEYVDLEDFRVNPAAIDAKLTQAGLEVESIDSQAEKFKHVVVGQIVELKAHENADKLTVCQVDVGDDSGLKQIVCGAKNHKAKDYVAVAQPGAVLPGNFGIKKSKIRGVESLGMLCSASELGMESEKSDGILILADADKKPVVGASFPQWAGFDDIIFEISVTPNRADCLSHLGLARELACLLGRKCKLPQIHEDFKNKSQSSGGIEVQLKDAKACPRYSGVAVDGVKVVDSPALIKKRLESVGVSSINNVVDITNFVMLELGQPMHAFDRAEINHAKIIIDNAKAKEKFTSLDGTEIQLTGDELMIRDGSRPVALAGVVGGKNSGINDQTKDIFFESAYFLHDTVRKTSRKYGIDTDSAYRFSRGTDPEGTLFALRRACFLLGQQDAKIKIATTYVDEYPHPVERSPIAISQTYMEERLGYAIKGQEFEEWMKRLDCEVSLKSQGNWIVIAPLYRVDLRVEVDLIEEFARLHGYDKIPETLPPIMSEPKNHVTSFVNERRLTQALSTEGYNEVINYNFIGEKYQREFLGDISKLKSTGLETWSDSVIIKNPLNDETDAMRLSLTPGLFANALRNVRHGTLTGRTFEVGRCFGKEATEYVEVERLGFLAWGQQEELWSQPQGRAPVYDLKSTLENFLQQLFIAPPLLRSLAEVPDFLHPKQSVGIFLEGKMIGYLGSLHPSIRERNKLRMDVAVCELQVDLVMRRQPRVPKLKSISKFPSVDRDLAFLMPNALATGDVAKELRKQGGAELQRVEVFDVFSGGSVPEGQRSVAFRMRFQHLEKTLDEAFLSEVLTKAISKVEQKFSIKVR